MEGWIKVHRKIQDNWLWKEKRKFSKFEAWMSLLLKANHKENKILSGNDIINIKAGSFITSEVKLADEWNWSRNTVRTFLTLLQNEKMLNKFCTTKYTMLSIENWALYQFEEQQIEQQVEQQIEHQKDIKLNTNKNDKNDNNEKNNNISSNSNKENDVAKINDLMIECLNTTNINNIKECINYLDKIPIELIEYGLKKTSRINQPSWKYAMTILDSYVQKGFTTLKQIQSDELQHKSKTNKNNEETQEEKTKRKIKELEELMNANK